MICSGYKHRVLLADDHAVLRAGLRLLINSQPDLEVVGEASTGLETLEQASRHDPEIVLMDIGMPGMDGLETARRLKAATPGVKVLFLTMHEDEEYLRRALAVGAAGYCPKSAADSELLSALRAVARGNVYIHPSHARLLVEGLLPDAGRTASPGPSVLSDREREVLRLVALGHTNQQAAQQLFLSVKTVETYRARLMEKLGLRSRAALVRYALEHGMLTTGPASPTTPANEKATSSGADD